MATLTLNLKGEYFDQIKSGEKTEEYRICKPFWAKRLEDRHYDQIVIVRGYAAKGDQEKRLVRPFRGYEIKTIIHPHFGSEPVTVYAIDVTGCDQDNYKQLALF
jgi:ASC-1-like (ASCH) protein